MTVEIQFKGFAKNGELAFSVRMNDHIIGIIGQNRLDDFAVLANDQGTQVQASQWQSIPSAFGPQHVFGTLYFPAKDASGRPLVNQEARILTLTIKELAQVPERVFQWNVPWDIRAERDRKKEPCGKCFALMMMRAY